MANSIPVVLASNQSNIDINIVGGNITGYSTSTKQDQIISLLGKIETAVEKIDNSTYVNNTTCRTQQDPII